MLGQPGVQVGKSLLSTSLAPVPALVPTNGRDKSAHWAQQESKREGPRMKEKIEREINHGRSQQGSGSFP